MIDLDNKPKADYIQIVIPYKQFKHIIKRKIITYEATVTKPFGNLDFLRFVPDDKTKFGYYIDLGILKVIKRANTQYTFVFTDIIDYHNKKFIPDATIEED